VFLAGCDGSVVPSDRSTNVRNPERAVEMPVDGSDPPVDPRTTSTRVLNLTEQQAPRRWSRSKLAGVLK
jgi:hypothetical protein